MERDLTEPTVTVRTTLRKFDGEGTDGKEPIETIVREDVVPVSSLPPGIRASLTKEGV